MKSYAILLLMFLAAFVIAIADARHRPARAAENQHCAGALVATVLAQDRPEPYPGQSQHQKPPDGWFCVTGALNKPPSSHDCFCHRECTKDADGHEEHGRDPKCTTDCHEKEHCKCTLAPCGS